VTLEIDLPEDERAFYEAVRRRALEAQRLLTYSSMTVSEVGYALGFDDPAYFSRAFRADVGQSPADFRRMRGRIRASRP